jgi:hypothetical protein
LTFDNKRAVRAVEPIRDALQGIAQHLAGLDDVDGLELRFKRSGPASFEVTVNIDVTVRTVEVTQVDLAVNITEPDPA